MKINLKKENRDELTTLRAQLATVFKEQGSSVAEMHRLLKKQDKLESEIATLQTSDPENETAATALATKRVQLERVVEKISELSNVPAGITIPQQQQSLNLLKQFARAACAATGSDVENYGRKIAANIRDFCQDDATAYGLAVRTPAYAALISKYTWPFGSFRFSLGELKQAIDRADEILSGELKWSYDAKKQAA